MKVLCVHSESVYFAGAQAVLAYFLEGARTANRCIGLAMVPFDRLEAKLPEGFVAQHLPTNQAFSIPGLWRQARAIARCVKQGGYDVIHGWTARDWEACALAGRFAGVPAVGSLHDHPRAPFLSGSRRLLMRGAAGWGLARVICVSEAVRAACATAGYPRERLTVVRNGLPLSAAVLRNRDGGGPLQIGFLGALTPRKGLGGFLEILRELAVIQREGWVVQVGGDVQDEPGRLWLERLRSTYAGSEWWGRVRWAGWVSPPGFLRGVDVLVASSESFDPLPTVLIEAGAEGVPVISTRVGGVAEIVRDGEGGWLIEPGEWVRGARILAGLAIDRGRLRRAGEAGRERVVRGFSLDRMIREFFAVYADVVSGGEGKGLRGLDGAT